MNSVQMLRMVLSVKFPLKGIVYSIGGLTKNSLSKVLDYDLDVREFEFQSHC